MISSSSSSSSSSSRKIIYAKCGVKNYMNEDHRSYRRNFCGKKAAKNSSSTVGVCDGSSSSCNTSGRNNKRSGGTSVLKIILKTQLLKYDA